MFYRLHHHSDTRKQITNINTPPTNGKAFIHGSLKNDLLYDFFYTIPFYNSFLFANSVRDNTIELRVEKVN